MERFNPDSVTDYFTCQGKTKKGYTEKFTCRKLHECVEGERENAAAAFRHHG